MNKYGNIFSFIKVFGEPPVLHICIMEHDYIKQMAIMLNSDYNWKNKQKYIHLPWSCFLTFWETNEKLKRLGETVTFTVASFSTQCVWSVMILQQQDYATTM